VNGKESPENIVISRFYIAWTTNGPNHIARNTPMRQYFSLISLLALTACSTPQPDKQIESLIPDGTWEGSLDWIVRMDGRKDKGGQGLAVAACGGQVRIWLMDENGNYRGPRKDFQVRSSLQSYSIQFIDKATVQPDWIEIQTYTLLELNGVSAAVQWSRSVNNRDLAPDDANRTIFEYGVGTLKKTRETCSSPPLTPV
jgi:hypothetical protein